MKLLLLIFASVNIFFVSFSQNADYIVADSAYYSQSSNEFQYYNKQKNYELRILKTITDATTVLAIFTNKSITKMGYSTHIDTGFYLVGYWNLGGDPTGGMSEGITPFYLQIIPPGHADSFYIDINRYNEYQFYFRICINVDSVLTILKEDGNNPLNERIINNRKQIYCGRSVYDLADIPGLFDAISVKNIVKKTRKHKYIRLYIFRRI